MFNWLRKLLGVMRLADVVWTEDHDGDARLRLVRRSPFDRYVVRGFLSRGMLKRDGTISGSPYMEHWMPYRVRIAFRHWMDPNAYRVPTNAMTAEDIVRRGPEIAQAISDHLRQSPRNMQ